ncbi:tyrosine-type recombinase/integrase (plasmid) [Rhizobium grahamii]|uniref:Tyrosine-type recombinase/integrase n=1 Tax=Rhizobium grahamii TaxID=1120045 RepID=A0A5Q0CGT1_9HYPH|nr:MULTISPECIES: tyrosine-type recombinase/integrase [Rhizobium]QFY63480.1 tyrosine-type recombinase/integrase [Rhizobium grahamii]QRM51756.1 tyrosine-type recombinase/integrase [Rhizobium sp. BG6]
MRVAMQVFHDGERFPMLLGDDNVPLFEPLVWVATKYRAASAASMEAALRGAMFLHRFCDRHQINLSMRLKRGNVFSLTEIEALLREALIPAKFANDEVSVGRMRNRSRKSQDEAYLPKRIPASRKAATVKSSTVAHRLMFATQYVLWLADRRVVSILESDYGSQRTEERITRYLAAVQRTVTAIQAQIPTPSSGDRLSLGDAGKKLFMQVVDPKSSQNPWKRPFIKVRNGALAQLLLAVGIRRGELLALRRRDFDRREGILKIVRRQDDPTYPKKRQSNVKTKERDLALTEDMCRVLEAYLVERNKIAPARKHDVLFVAQNGAPLSESSFTAIFGVLKTRFPLLGPLCGHVLRHQWNEDYSNLADREGMSEKDENETRIYNMGWSEKSHMPSHYNRRRIRKKATEFSLKHQSQVMANATIKPDE